MGYIHMKKLPNLNSAPFTTKKFGAATPTQTNKYKKCTKKLNSNLQALVETVVQRTPGHYPNRANCGHQLIFNEHLSNFFIVYNGMVQVKLTLHRHWPSGPGFTSIEPAALHSACDFAHVPNHRPAPSRA